MIRQTRTTSSSQPPVERAKLTMQMQPLARQSNAFSGMRENHAHKLNDFPGAESGKVGPE